MKGQRRAARCMGRSGSWFMVVCHIKQKDLDKQKFKRNKPCKQFRKQNSKDFCEDTKFAIFKYEYVP